jgi:hypothetical protein
MVDILATASSADKQSLFHAALAVRYIEIGLASMFCLSIGFTAVIFSVAIYTEERFPRWIAYIGSFGGTCTGIAGAVIAYTGFSELSMIINMPANILLLAWMLILSVYQWRHF